MKRIQRLIGIILLALVASLGTPQAFANGGTGEMAGITAVAHTDGTAESPGIIAAILDYLAVIL